MKHQRFENAKNSISLCGLFILLTIIFFQLFKMYKTYEAKFEKPIEFIKGTYGNDYITQYGAKFTEVKKVFPTITHFTYVGEANEDFSSRWTHYFLTQYYMVPNLTAYTKEPLDTILYNLYNSKQLDAATNFHLNNGWHILQDFNNGLIVLAK